MSSARPGRGWWPAALGLTLLVAILPQFALGALGPQLRADLGLAPDDLGLVFAGLYAIGVVGSPLAGPLVDRLGGRRSCLALLLVSGAALLLASVAGSRAGLVAAMVPAGAAMAFANPGTNRWAAAAASPRAQATLVGVGQAGVQAGALVAGLLAAAFTLGLDWRASLQIGAGLAVAGVVAAWRSPTDAPAPLHRGAGPPTGLALPSGAAARRLMLYALLMGAGTSVVFAYLPTFAVDVAGLTIAAAGATAIVYGATALTCRVALGVVLRRPDELARPLLLAMGVGAAVAIVLIALGGLDARAVWAGAVVFGATGTTWPAVAFLATVRAGPPGAAGRLAGWVAAAFYLGLWAGPPAAGATISAFGYAPVWAAAATCYLAACWPAAGLRMGPVARRPGGAPAA